MSAVARLCEIIATGGKASADHPAMADLLKHGFLRGAGVLEAVVCDECTAPHSAKVVSEGETYGFFCPDLGFVGLERQHIRAFLPDMPVLIERLADAFQCKRRKGSPVHGGTWRVGAAEAEVGEIMLYFHPRLQDENDLRACADALSREMRSQWRLILTGAGGFPVLGGKTVALFEVVELETATGALRVLADPAELVGMPLKRKVGRPSAYAAGLGRIMAERAAQRLAHDGLNEEAKAIKSEYEERFPSQPCPSLPTVKRYLTDFRTGS